MKRLQLFLLAALSLALFVYLSNKPENKPEKTAVQSPACNHAHDGHTCTLAHSTPQSTNHSHETERMNPQVQTAPAIVSWPQEVITSLKNAHSDRSDAIDHIIRATTFENFAALSNEKSERLINYADHVIELPPHLILSLCWGRDTPAEERSAFEAVRTLALSEATSMQPIFRFTDRWQQTATDENTGSSGTPVTIRWSLVPDGTPVPDDLNNYSGSNLITTFNNEYGAPVTPGDLTTAPWFEIFEDAFAYWAEATGNTYIYEPNDDGAAFPGLPGVINVRGDVRIGGTVIDGNSGILAFNYFPDLGDMVLDTSDAFVVDPDVTTLNFVKNIIAHEHGHGLGLEHVCPDNETKLMEPFATDAFSGPQFDDILTTQALYGDPFEGGSSKNNDLPATASDLGTLNLGVSVEELSIADSTDKDLFKFQVDSLRGMNVRVSPTSVAPYLEGVQNSNLSCSAGVFYDPQNRQDLAIRVLAADGETVLANSDSAGIGSPESIDQLQLTDLNQDYYIEVTGGGENGGSLNNAQAYDIEIELINPSTLQISDPLLVSESCSPANETIDPGEVVTISVDLSNIGTEDSLNSSITLSGGNDLIILGDAVQQIGTLNVGASATSTFSFILSGECEDFKTITLRADNDDGSFEKTVNYQLGSINSIASEDFENVANFTLPDGWSTFTTNITAFGARWQTVLLAGTDSPRRAVYSAGFDDFNSAVLTHPEINGIVAGSQLQFEHQYITEDRFDGGVLEISINNGSWTD